MNGMGCILAESVNAIGSMGAEGSCEILNAHIKVAAVMLVQHESAAVARRRLDSADGRLAVAIGRRSSEHPGLQRI